jgi:hypothetical protein
MRGTERSRAPSSPRLDDDRARRGDEIVTATWFDEVAVGHIGWHSTPDRERSLSNQSEVRKIIDGSTAG